MFVMSLNNVSALDLDIDNEVVTYPDIPDNAERYIIVSRGQCNNPTGYYDILIIPTADEHWFMGSGQLAKGNYNTYNTYCLSDNEWILNSNSPYIRLDSSSNLLASTENIYAGQNSDDILYSSGYGIHVANDSNNDNSNSGDNNDISSDYQNITMNTFNNAISSFNFEVFISMFVLVVSAVISIIVGMIALRKGYRWLVNFLRSL